MDDWREVKGRKPRPLLAGPLGWLVLLFAALGVYFVGIQPLFHRHDPEGAAGDPRAMELARLKMLGRALRLHADEHDGKFPTAISEINWRQNMPGMDWNGLPAAVSRFHNPETGKVSDWLYYAGHTENDPPETILAAAPETLGKGKDRRMVVRANGVAEIVAEADFLRPVAEQVTP